MEAAESVSIEVSQSQTRVSWVLLTRVSGREMLVVDTGRREEKSIKGLSYPKLPQ